MRLLPVVEIEDDLGDAGCLHEPDCLLDYHRRKVHGDRETFGIGRPGILFDDHRFSAKLKGKRLDDWHHDLWSRHRNVALLQAWQVEAGSGYLQCRVQCQRNRTNLGCRRQHAVTEVARSVHYQLTRFEEVRLRVGFDSVNQLFAVQGKHQKVSRLERGWLVPHLG